MKIKCLLKGHTWMGESKFGNRCCYCGKQTHTEYGKKFEKQFIKLQKLNSGATFSEMMEMTENLIKLSK